MSQSHCTEGQKPKVIYKFANGVEREFNSKYAPIEVITSNKPLRGSDNFGGTAYTIEFWQDDPFTGYFSRLENIIDWEVYQIYKQVFERVGYKWYRYISFWVCGENDWRRSGNNNTKTDQRPWGNKATIIFQPETLQIIPTGGCPSAINKCSIKVLYKGLVIHQDQGDCPVTYRVKCGNCEENEIECKSNHYPGFCCIPCSEVVNRLNTMSNKL